MLRRGGVGRLDIESSVDVRIRTVGAESVRERTDIFILFMEDLLAFEVLVEAGTLNRLNLEPLRLP